MQYPDRVASVVAIDIGDANSPEFRKSLSLAAKGMVAAYQLTLALAWYSGKRVGSYITRGVAKGLKAKAKSEQIHVGMNYPYAMRWMGANGGFDALLPVELSCPVFYAFGSKKPFLFHSPQWADKLRSESSNVIRKFECGHWVMVDRAEEFNAAVNKWLMETKA
jgi:pimeloyl-ACP methyl ester carboxylesterase